jgi:hypothetical protein
LTATQCLRHYAVALPPLSAINVGGDVWGGLDKSVEWSGMGPADNKNQAYMQCLVKHTLCTVYVHMQTCVEDCLGCWASSICMCTCAQAQSDSMGWQGCSGVLKAVKQAKHAMLTYSAVGAFGQKHLCSWQHFTIHKGSKIKQLPLHSRCTCSGSASMRACYSLTDQCTPWKILSVWVYLIQPI